MIIKNFCLRYLSIISICFVCLLVVFSVLVLTNKIHDQNANYTYIMGIVTLFVSGFLLSNHFQTKGFLIGAGQSILYILIFYLICTLAFDYSFSFNLSVKYLLYLVSGMLGGVIGVNFKRFV